jgi:adenylosuccinate synthase
MKYSTNAEYIAKCEPVYEEFEGNFGDISGVKTREELPEKAQIYLNRIEEIVGVPIKFIGTGADREDMIVVE